MKKAQEKEFDKLMFSDEFRSEMMRRDKQREYKEKIDALIKLFGWGE